MSKDRTQDREETQTATFYNGDTERQHRRIEPLGRVGREARYDRPERAPRPLPPEHQAILDRTTAPNGLDWRKVWCGGCNRHVVDEGVLMGCVRKKCTYCKHPNVIEYNRVGEDGTPAFGVKVHEGEELINSKLAPNGLAWRVFACDRCGWHLCDQAVLIGCLQKKCPECKYPTVRELSRVGEDALEEYAAMRRARSTGGINNAEPADGGAVPD